MPDRPSFRPVYKALHRPLTIWGVERRQFFLALLLGAATFNLFYSFLAGLLMFAGCTAVRCGPLATIPSCSEFCLRRPRSGADMTRASTGA
jgi:hypothetical protein